MSPAEGEIVRGSVVAVTVTVTAESERIARERANRAIVTEMASLGMV